MDTPLEPNLTLRAARHAPAWGVATPALIAVASALYMVALAEPGVDALATNPPTVDRPLGCAENDSAYGPCSDEPTPLGCVVARSLARGPLELHLYLSTAWRRRTANAH
jgi:hypothetical protein